MTLQSAAQIPGGASGIRRAFVRYFGPDMMGEAYSALRSSELGDGTLEARELEDASLLMEKKVFETQVGLVTAQIESLQHVLCEVVLLREEPADAIAPCILWHGLVDDGGVATDGNLWKYWGPAVRGDGLAAGSSSSSASKL